MRLLLDSNALIWFAEGNPKLTEKARNLIEDPANTVLVSAASAWEIATKHRLGHLPQAGVLATAFEAEVYEYGFDVVSITAAHGRVAGAFSSRHKDPFDRMISAQALLDGMLLLSNDAECDAFGVTRVW
jgi:PIN domain nuclease of toxin-antitoxin system